MRTTDDIDISAALAWVAQTAGPLTGVRQLVGGMTSTMVAVTTEAGREPQPYFDVMDIVGFLPPPGKRALVDLEDIPTQRRIEERLRQAVSRAHH